MIKNPILDTTVHLAPGPKLLEFLKEHTHKGTPLPDNVRQILGIKGGQQAEKSNPVKFTKDEIQALQELAEPLRQKHDEMDNNEPSGVQDVTEDPKVADIEVPTDTVPVHDSRPSLTNSDLRWLFEFLNEERQTDPETPFLHELLEGSDVKLPENHFVERNPVLEERCKKLRKEQEQREYNKMTKNVDNVRKRDPEDTIGYQMRTINSQLIAILQFVFSVAAGFAFGFVGIALIVGDLDFGFRLLLGIMFALIIALAEIYFLAKKLNEDYEVKPDGPIFNDYGKEVAAKTKKDN